MWWGTLRQHRGHAIVRENFTGEVCDRNDAVPELRIHICHHLPSRHSNRNRSAAGDLRALPLFPVDIAIGLKPSQS
jgi:hypothetical protein